MCLNILCEDMYFGARRIPGSSGWIVAMFAGIALVAGRAAASDRAGGSPSTVVANDNTRPAGALAGDTLTVRLRAASGSWRPEGPQGPALTIPAFGEDAGPLTVPAPLMRATEGTAIAVSIRNDLDTPLTVHGLCTRDGGPCDPFDVPPGGTRDVRFPSGVAGTYHYWASSMGARVPSRELAGAFVIDPRGTCLLYTSPSPRDS